MSTRLDCIYQMIPKGGRGIIDVGTDHALIPIRLAENNYQGTIFASDIADAPLALAKRTAIEHKAEKKIRFQCCDGLEQCPSDEVDTILIAGMGGDSICGILDRTEWLFSGDYCLILQPMTQAAVVRYWLVHNGFRIDQEKLVQEGRHIYQVFLAVMGNSEGMMDSEYLIGRRNAGQDQ